MANRDELKYRLEELFSSPIEAESPTQPEESESLDLPAETASADDQPPSVSATASSAMEEPARVTSSPATEASSTDEKVAETSVPVELVEQAGAPATPPRPTGSAAWRKQAGGLARQAKAESSRRARLRMFSNRSLRFRIISAFLIVTVLTVGVVTFVSDRAIRDRLTQDVGQSLKSLAVSNAQEVGSLLTNQVNMLQTLALNDVVLAGVETANGAYVGEAAAIQAEIDGLDQQWRAADAANNDADPLVSARLNNPMASALTRFRESFPDNVEVFVTDQRGALLATTNRTSDYNQADEEWWQVAYNGGQGDVYIGQPEFDESSRTLSVNIAVPVYAPDTRSVVGVLRTTLDIGALRKIFAQSGRSDLLLPTGEMIRSEGDVVSSEPETLAQLQSSTSADYAEFVYEGEPNLISQAPVTSLDPAEAALVAKLQWTLVVARDSAAVLAPVNAAAQTTLFTGLGTFLVAALLALGLAQILVRPITRLTAVAEKVAEGDLGVQANVESGDEIGTLATTFNFMTAQLRETLEGLEQRIAARTRDLALAAEVSRGVSSLRELDTLLANAVELIRERFDLYHAQIYLTDAAGRNLALRASTGSVGLELLHQAHRLPISPGSINGTAAAEKHAVIVADTAHSGIFRPNPLLPDTRSEMAVPLIASGRVVGVLDLQSAQPGALTEENLPAFEALAGQLAIAIENAALFGEIEQAQAEVEAQAHRLTRAGWEEFLNAIDRNERVGYTYENQVLAPLSEGLPASPDHGLAVPIAVTGEPIGTIVVEHEADAVWDAGEAELVNAVAARVAQQVENMRLLAQAEKYRAEAEAAARRLTREGWENYLETLANKNSGYVYDLNEVTPLAAQVDSNGNGSSVFTRMLMVRDETIGELAIDDVEHLGEEAAELASVVAEQLSAHIENLRLLEETEHGRQQLDKRAAELQTVARVSATASSVLDAEQLLQTVVSLTQRRFDLYHAHIFMLNDAGDALDIVACGWPEGDPHEGTHGNRSILLNQEQSLVARSARTRQAVVVNDVQADPGWLPTPLLPDTRSEMAVPLIVGDKLLGIFDVQSEQVDHFTEEDLRIQSTLAAQVAIALQNAKLYAEQAATVIRLRELDQLKSSFLANMSHELRTPLNSILGFIDVMLEGLDGPLTEQMSNDLKLISRNGQHLLSLINNVLDMAKIEAGKMNLNIERFNLLEVLEEVVNITGPLARDKSLALRLENTSPNGLELAADRIRLRQVLLNLVSNAIKFTDTGSVRLQATHTNEHIRISVCDTGVGIPREQAQDIFEEFRQVDNSTTRKVGGTGLGLPISRRLVELHGGRLWVESKGVPGEGSTFVVELPAESADRPATTA